MQTYLVGGAVRDRLLGLPVRERDWVVVGATPAELEAQGYRRVGASFPVFLHAVTGEEYALARTERKTGPGYRGFAIDADPGVTLEEDLRRRDLTINAMAEDPAGGIIDPYGGQADLAARQLRHVSDAFREDPVRILRVARFAARFAPLGFRVAPGTLQLMREMVAAGEAAALVPERVWQETERALSSARPDVFIATLKDCGALAVIFPEVAALWGVPQVADWHPEVDTGTHLLLALEQAARLSPRAEVRFAVLVHDLGKGTTPPAEWPRHIGHEERGVALVEALCRRLGAPNRFRELGCAMARWHGLCHRALELRPPTILRLLEGVDAWRRAGRFEDFLLACEADARGRSGRADTPYPQAALLRRCLQAAQAVDAASLVSAGLAAEALREALREARTRAIAACLQD
ncbi:Multifunctional CCA protein [Gammaproteobacteria bacterium]|nr:multifunctional CCA addition/repair protein [Gammaproteobacteria bacterium]CAG0940852.1 Multifunctional CCA protein [Gammaproteobacteria bacterium]